MSVYQVDFDYTFALADISASIDGADSMDFSQERPAPVSYTHLTLPTKLEV